jgi:hypothetical protein
VSKAVPKYVKDQAMVFNEQAIQLTNIYSVELAGGRPLTGLPAFSKPAFGSSGQDPRPTAREGSNHKSRGPSPGQRAKRLEGVYLNERFEGDLATALRRTLRDHAAVSTHITGITYLVSSGDGWWTPYGWDRW